MPSVNLTRSALLIAAGLILPLLLHTLGAAGSIFLPMHIPVLLAGFCLGPYCGLAVGLLTPALSSLLTGMPPLLPVLPLMLAELGVYGWCGGYLYQRRRWPLWLALPAAMLAGRLASLFVLALCASALGIHLPAWSYATAGLITGLPGIVIQLILIPLILKRVNI
ncbi:ECF transporter S component [uncultured Phascolarctobacterium sp.]|uniref:ECF transporter S component n=1 Tax=uncultured Phascolarctobacterium sp. TaxID=512296 RepID=UPI0025EB5217|nr:ECF transporter S component [uncultured Phascolarctobacterium sp.]